jgi:hypothetical protein
MNLFRFKQIGGSGVGVHGRSKGFIPNTSWLRQNMPVIGAAKERSERGRRRSVYNVYDEEKESKKKIIV